ncbi:MAG: 8-amino-7-oxononanoate synthase [Bacteroidota bacterium]|nr:8-amino-7-oxononanoate synthase [Bacteroidota bacterium]
MLNPVEDRLRNELAALEQKQRKRDLRISDAIDFTSNDYLGLTQSPVIKARVIRDLQSGMLLGSGGSRLLRGNHVWHQLAEKEFAEFEDVEAALFFSSGYAANMAVLTAIPTRRDVILYDTMVHASIKEGIHSSLAAKKTFEHKSVASLRAAAESIKDVGNMYVVVESLYSMDGDEAPLEEIAAVCSELKLYLIVDEAHATGLFGKHGRGLIDDKNIREQILLSIHPCGKALAAAGAFVCSSEIIKSYLINKARTMIFTTALPPIVPATISEVLKEIKRNPAIIKKVHQNADYVREKLRSHLKKWIVPEGRSPIIPLIVGDDRVSVAVAAEMQMRGADIRPIRPPTVAEGTARFRITVSALHTKKDLDLLCDGLIEVEAHYL